MPRGPSLMVHHCPLYPGSIVGMLNLIVFGPESRLATVIASLSDNFPSGPAGERSVPPSISSAVVFTVRVGYTAAGAIRSSRRSSHGLKGGRFFAGRRRATLSARRCPARD